MMFHKKVFTSLIKKPCDDHQNEDELSQSSGKSIFYHGMSFSWEKTHQILKVMIRALLF